MTIYEFYADILDLYESFDEEFRAGKNLCCFNLKEVLTIIKK